MDLETKGSTLLELATGLGKTVVFSFLADEWPGKVLILAHREELVQQACEKINIITGRSVAVEMGRSYARHHMDYENTKITAGSIQTFSITERREKFKPDLFSLIIVDEGHHAPARSYRRVLDYFETARKLFVTATPKRHDKLALGTVCESVSYQYGIERAVQDGWLVPIRQCMVKVHGLDYSRARTLAKDFNQADLEAILLQEEPLHRMVSSAQELVGDRQTLWFCVSVAHARAMAGVLGRYVPAERVAFLSGETPAEERAKKVRDYKAGKLRHLFNCALFLEGFDAPTTSAIAMCRPTKSLPLYTQVLGRGTRPLPDVVDGLEDAEDRKEAIRMSDKQDMLVVDYCGNAGKHKIIQALDVLGGLYPEDVLELALANQEEDEDHEERDVEAALQRAEAELALLGECSEMRKEITAKVAYAAQEVSPFIRRHTDSSAKPPPAYNGQGLELCSSKQAGYIMYLARRAGMPNWRIDDALRMTKRQAGATIEKLKAMVDV